MITRLGAQREVHLVPPQVGKCFMQWLEVDPIQDLAHLRVAGDLVDFERFFDVQFAAC